MPRSDRLSALDLAEALQLAHAAAALHELGVLDSLPATAEELAKKHRVDAAMLRGVLHYLAARTSLVRSTGGRFASTREYSREARFVLELYTLAYAGNAAQLATLLRKPRLAAGAVDRVRHARAFEGSGTGALPAIVRQLGLDHLLDLGCGPGAMLVALAQHDPAFTGWGLERNPAMIKAARANIRAAGVGKRIRVLEGDAFRPRLPRETRDQIRAVTASQLANELFGRGVGAAVAWLRRLRRTFPGRPLLLADYYGRLGRAQTASRETLLHDYAQLISGQGIPPASFREWRRIYAEAGCRPVDIIEDRSTTLFVHVVLL